MDPKTDLEYAVKTIENNDDFRVYGRETTKVDGFVSPLKFAFSLPSSEIKFFVNQAISLYSILPQSGEVIDENAARFYLAEIILALEDLQECEPRHLFFRLDDIYIDILGHITFNDFSISTVKMARDAVHQQGLEYMAPEIIKGKDCRWTTNFWSLGVIMFEICCGWSPFKVDYPKKSAEMICGVLEYGSRRTCSR